MKNILLTIVALLLGLGSTNAAEPLTPAETPPEPAFNRLSDFDEVTALLKGYAAAYPDWVTLETIGKSTEGRDIWLLTLNNPATGELLSKPAMYVDGNTHGNEIQGTEAVLYTIDFLLNNYGRLERVTELLDRAAFYFVPVVNPDSRADWFAGPSTPNYPRTVKTPVDDDRDGQVDEDGYEDLDGDGVITQMRKKVPLGQGTHRLHPNDPRILVPIENDEHGDYIELGAEGFDNDGDGRINEDGVGYVDPNRSWGYGWQPRYVQSGAHHYPLSIPETRSIAVWALTAPNIAAVQTFHNSGGMILRIPGAKAHPRLQPEDLKAYDLIGEQGERMLPGYEYMVVWKDLYTSHGATDDHFYRVHGAISYTNELYKAPLDLDGDGKITDEERMEFSDVLTLGRQFLPWKEVDHPQYGTVEVGGYRHDVGRIPEGWMLEEDTHRNSAFVLLHAHHLPKIRFGEPEIERLEGDLWQLQIPVLNERATPTMLAVARRDKLHRPDLATVEGARVVASGLVHDRWLDKVELQKHRPERLMVPGVGGLSSRTLFFLLEGKGDVVIRYDSLKGGRIEREVRLQ
jgi:hypothetical protein